MIFDPLVKEVIDRQTARGERCPRCRAMWLFCNCGIRCWCGHGRATGGSNG